MTRLSLSQTGSADSFVQAVAESRGEAGAPLHGRCAGAHGRPHGWAQPPNTVPSSPDLFSVQLQVEYCCPIDKVQLDLARSALHRKAVYRRVCIAPRMMFFGRRSLRRC